MVFDEHDTNKDYFNSYIIHNKPSCYICIHLYRGHTCMTGFQLYIVNNLYELVGVPEHKLGR